MKSTQKVIATGTLRAQFDQNSKIELLEFVTSDHKEFLQRSQIKSLLSPLSSPDQKSSPKQTKTMGKQKAQQRPPPPPPVQLPESQINNNGVTDEVSKFLEVCSALSGTATYLINRIVSRTDLCDSRPTSYTVPPIALFNPCTQFADHDRA